MEYTHTQCHICGSIKQAAGEVLFSQLKHPQAAFTYKACKTHKPSEVRAAFLKMGGKVLTGPQAVRP